MKRYSSKSDTYDDIELRQNGDSAPNVYRSRITVGGASIFTLLVVMCLGVFALITVTAATREQSLANRAASASKSYYDANFSAEELLARVQAAYNSESNLKKLEQWIKENEPGIETKYLRGSLTLRFTEESDDLILHAEAVVTKGKITKTVWETESKNTWTTAPLPVWDGQLPPEMIE